MNSVATGDIDVSIILPRYREGFEVMQDTLRKVSELKWRYKIQIIIINDCPKNHFFDEDINRVRASFASVLVVSNGRNYGKGHSIRRGVDLARGKVIFYSDIDFPIGCDDFYRAHHLVASGDADIVIGERFSRNRVRANSCRSVASRLFLRVFNLLFDPAIADTQCPFKLFRAEVAKELFSLQRVDGYAFDAEVLHLAGKRQKKIAQMPITWEDTRENWHLVKTLRNYVVMFADLFSVKLRSTLIGSYRT